MFRRLESINEGLQPKIYGNTYLTVQTESHKLPEIPNNIPPKSFSKYSYYKTHKETPEYIVANMIAKEADISVYKSIPSVFLNSLTI